MPHIRRSSLLTLALFAVLLSYTPMRSFAQTDPNQWLPNGAFLSPSDEPQVVWIKSSYSATDSYLGDSVQVWTLDATDAEESKTGTMTKGPNWAANGGGYAPDGSIRLGWTKRGTTSSSGVYSGDTISVSSYTSDGVKTLAGPTYFKGEGWYSIDVSTMADGTIRARWFKPGTINSSGVYSGDEAAIWALDTNGNVTSKGPTLTKGPNWYLSNELLMTLPDGTARMLWKTQPASNTDAGKATVWTLSATGQKIAEGPVYTKPDGWQAFALGSASDGTLRFFWVRGTKATIWATDTAGNETAEGPVYTAPSGLYPYGFDVEPSGASLIFWSTSEWTQKFSFWIFDASGTVTDAGPRNSRAAAWTTTITNAVIESDGTIDLMWILPPASSKAPSGKASMWTFNDSGTVISGGPNLSF